MVLILKFYRIGENINKEKIIRKDSYRLKRETQPQMPMLKYRLAHR